MAVVIERKKMSALLEYGNDLYLDNLHAGQLFTMSFKDGLPDTFLVVIVNPMNTKCIPIKNDQ